MIRRATSEIKIIGINFFILSATLPFKEYGSSYTSSK